jgi:hypothetical protein
MLKKSIKDFVRYAVRFSLLCFCACLLTSCGTVTGLLGYLISIPFRIIDTVLPG